MTTQLQEQRSSATVGKASLAGSDSTESRIAAAPGMVVVQSNKLLDAHYADLDFEAVRRAAQAARNEWVAAKLRSLSKSLLHNKQHRRTDAPRATPILDGLKNKAA